MATPELFVEPIEARELTAVLKDDASRQGFLQTVVPEIASGEWRLLSTEPPFLSKGWRKRVLVLPVVYGVNGLVKSEGWIVKLYGKKDGGPGYEAQAWLWKAGFRPPSSFLVPRPYAYSAECRALIQAHVEGLQWADYLTDEPGTLRSASDRSARWLVRLQESGMPGDAHESSEELSALSRIVTELSRVHPAGEARFRALGEELALRLLEEGGPLVPAHGDFHPKNVLLDDARNTLIDLDRARNEIIDLDGARNTVIDFDHAGLREAGFDVGYAIGQLLVISYLRHGTLLPGAEAAAAFWRSYRERGRAPRRRVCIHVARTLFQSLHFELCVLKNGRLDLLTRWPDLVEQWLPSETQPALLARLERLANPGPAPLKGRRP